VKNSTEFCGKQRNSGENITRDSGRNTGITRGRQILVIAMTLGNIIEYCIMLVNHREKLSLFTVIALVRWRNTEGFIETG
jgi:hypothetical protein